MNDPEQTIVADAAKITTEVKAEVSTVTTEVKKVEAAVAPVVAQTQQEAAAWLARARTVSELKAAEEDVVTSAKAAAGALKALGKWLLNKAVMIVVLCFSTWVFAALPTENLPFAEIYYAVVKLCWFCLLPSLARLLVFPEAAEYAESGQLRKDLAGGFLTAPYLHYRFVTALCWAATGACFILVK